MVEYMFRGHAMKRAPKREYYVPGQDPPVYKWGQQKIHYPGGSDYTGLPMPDWMIMLKDKINMDFNANTNHAIIRRGAVRVLRGACIVILALPGGV